jgi:hypothetical protein
MDAAEEHDEGFLALMPAGSGVVFPCATDLVTEVIMGLKSFRPVPLKLENKIQRPMYYVLIV